MRIYQLKSFRDVLVINNQTGNKVVLTPIGAVYENFMTSDTRNMCSAYSALFDDNWRRSNKDEEEKFCFSFLPEKVVSNQKDYLRLVVNNC
jgi:hypothetical protein